MTGDAEKVDAGVHQLVSQESKTPEQQVVALVDGIRAELKKFEPSFPNLMAEVRQLLESKPETTDQLDILSQKLRSVVSELDFRRSYFNAQFDAYAKLLRQLGENKGPISLVVAGAMRELIENDFLTFTDLMTDPKTNINIYAQKIGETNIANAELLDKIINGLLAEIQRRNDFGASLVKQGNQIALT